MTHLHRSNALAGAWSGTNGFRLMPADEMAARPASAALSIAAGASMLSFRYEWEHPADGAQDGLLVTWATGEGDAAVAVWADSWHQQPVPATMTGTTPPDSIVDLTYTYGGNWGWRIALSGTDSADALRLVMYNVIPDEAATAETAAGPYVVMDMALRRTAP